MVQVGGIVRDNHYFPYTVGQVSILLVKGVTMS